MLTSTFNAFVNKQFQESFDTTLMRIMKNSLKKKNQLLFFYNKKFQKEFRKPIFEGIY